MELPLSLIDIGIIVLSLLIVALLVAITLVCCYANDMFRNKNSCRCLNACCDACFRSGWKDSGSPIDDLIEEEEEEINHVIKNPHADGFPMSYPPRLPQDISAHFNEITFRQNDEFVIPGPGLRSKDISHNTAVQGHVRKTGGLHVVEEEEATIQLKETLL